MRYGRPILPISKSSIRVNNYICSCALLLDNVQIESISSTVNNEKPVNDNGIFQKRKPDIHLRGVTKMKFKRTNYHLLGHSPKLCYFYSFAVHYTKK